MDSALCAKVERFCRQNNTDPLAFDAFAQLVEQDAEEEIRDRIKHWREVRDSRTGRLVGELIGDASFPVDGTAMAIKLSSA